MFSRELTSEEQRINDAIDAHHEAKDDERHALWAAVALYFAGLIIAGAASDGSRLEHVGNTLFICGIVVFFVHLLLGFRTQKRRWAVVELMEPYQRRKALPFYKELQEMFADKPGVHLHLESDGRITVTDKRKREEKK